jgi:hypothetical protein
VTRIGKYAFGKVREAYESMVSSVTLPESLETIGENAFQDSWNLEEITIPANVTAIERGAFSTCNLLVDVTCLAPTPPELGEFNFHPWRGNAILSVVDQDARDLYMDDDAWSAPFASIIVSGYAPVLITAVPLVMEAPVAGVAPSTITSGTEQYTVYYYSWLDAVQFVDVPGVFGYNMQYCASVLLVANEGYTFEGGFTSSSDILGFYINGIDGVAYDPVSGNSGSAISFMVRFTATAPAPEPPGDDIGFGGEDEEVWP